MLKQSKINEASKTFKIAARNTGRGFLNSVQACLLIELYKRNHTDMSVSEAYHYVSKGAGLRDLEKSHLYVAAEKLVELGFATKKKEGCNWYTISVKGNAYAESIIMNAR